MLMTTASTRPRCADARLSSASTLPSASTTTRSTTPAISRSWVTITTVVPAGGEAGKQLEDRVRRARIEVAGRLVREQHRRVVGERAGDGGALLLPARQGRGQLVGLVGDADAVEQLERPRRGVRARGRSRRSPSAASTFSATVSVGSSWKNWKTMPTFLPRHAGQLDLAEVVQARAGDVDLAGWSDDRSR